MDEQEFRRRADKSLDELSRLLNEAGGDYGFEADFNAGALTVEFDESADRFVVSPNAPVRQIWVSANVKSYKLDWDDGEQTFVLPATGQTLNTLMEEAIGQALGQQVHL